MGLAIFEEGEMHDKQKEIIKVYFSSMEKFSDSSLPHSEFLYIVHEFSSTNKIIDRSRDEDINWLDFMPGPKSLSQILRLSPAVKEKNKNQLYQEKFKGYLKTIPLTQMKDH